MVISWGIIGGSISVILIGGVAERWAKDGVETIAKWIKRKWPKLCRKRLCDGEVIARN